MQGNVQDSGEEERAAHMCSAMIIMRITAMITAISIMTTVTIRATMIMMIIDSRKSD